MTERDEEGRPIATHNAGAFLSPVGMIPVPSKMLDESGTSQPPVAGRPWTAIATSVAIFALLDLFFRFLLLASQQAADARPIFIGDHMTRMMHSQWSWYAANAAFVAIGVVLAGRRFSGWRRSDRALLWGASIAGAVVVNVVVAFTGGVVAVTIAAAAIGWLTVDYLRPRRAPTAS